MRRNKKLKKSTKQNQQPKALTEMNKKQNKSLKTTKQKQSKEMQNLMKNVMQVVCKRRFENML